MARHLLLAALVLAAVIAAPVTAQDGKKYTLEPKEGGWEVSQLLAKLASLPDVTVQYDPQSPQIARKKIRVEGTIELEAPEFFVWIRAVLFQNRLVLVPIGPEEAHTFSVVDLNSTQISSHPVHVPEAEIEKWANRDGAYITTTITLKHLHETSRARNALAQLCTRQVGRINDVPSTRSFVVSDFAPVVASMYRLLMAMEKEAAATEPALRAAKDPVIQQYERLLASCHTETAAKYFISRIEALMPKKDAE